MPIRQGPVSARGNRFGPRDHQRYWNLRTVEGFSVEKAGERVGISSATAWRWEKGDTVSMEKKAHAGNPMAKVGDPKAYGKLSDLAKRMIAPDGFPLFAEKVFGFRSVPWQIKAAKVSVDAILDRSERHYGIANEPPGVGKSTIWTLAIPAWLLCGGGREDPEWGRSLRFMFGHASKGISTHYVQRFARMLDSTRPYYDKAQRRYGEVCLAKEFGRFRPWQSLGDISLWQNVQFIVAQIEDVDLADKEPTCQAAAPGAEYVGERCEYASWDDLVTEKTSRTLEGVAALSDHFQKEAEQRIEPGGILWLIGQRINSIDLFRDRLNDFWLDEEGNSRPKYFHIMFPAHNEATCDGTHRQWDAEPNGTGCLLDEVRLPWRDILKVAQTPHFRTIFQQEDTDPSQSLVTNLMIDGGSGYESDPISGEMVRVQYPGNWDHERGWGEFPPRVNGLVNYACVDPSVTGNWAIEWWATRGMEDIRYFIWGHRAKMGPGDLLDWDDEHGVFVGWMEKLQAASIVANNPIRCWVIESNAAFKHLFGYRHFQRFRERYPFVEFMPHQTQKNKTDPIMGVRQLLRHKYRLGLASMPRRSGDLKALTYMNAKVRELTTWPEGGSDDTVMCDWFGEANMDTILRVGRKPMRQFEVEAQLPEYLLRRRREVPTRRET